MNREIKPYFKRFILLLVLAAAVFIFGFNSHLVEHLYAEGLYSITSVIQRFISGLIPVPIGDFLYILLILYVLRCIYLFYRKAITKKLKKTDRIVIPLKVLSFLLLLYLVFKILWGLNYSRVPIAKQLGINDEKYNTPELVLLGKYFVNQLNELQGAKREHFDITGLKNHAKIAYDKTAQKQAFFKYLSPSVKPVLNSWIITKIGIEGYYNPLSGEANVNMRIPAISLPFITCHEMAHQLGVAREDEANLVGYLVAINSDNATFRYSAAYSMLKSILFEIRIKSPEDYSLLYKTINPVTLKDMKNDRDYWQKYNSDMFAYMDLALDSFLKLNNQPKGTGSYQDIVLWLYNIHKEEIKKL